MRPRTDTTLTRGQLEAVLRSLRRGTRRLEALRQAGVDPVAFAAEYRRSSLLREEIMRAEGHWPSDRVTPENQPFGAPSPRMRGSSALQDAGTAAPPEPSRHFSGWILWLVVLLPLLLAVTLLAAGAAPDLPSLAGEDRPFDGVGWHHECIAMVWVRLPI